ncbi:kinase-like domain-containing protein [Hysterangium stoloniferum]|nr:kinase-like domain-containing protein [Hysterangium stoloniferum]
MPTTTSFPVQNPPSLSTSSLPLPHSLPPPALPPPDPDPEPPPASPHSQNTPPAGTPPTPSHSPPPGPTSRGGVSGRYGERGRVGSGGNVRVWWERDGELELESESESEREPANGLSLGCEEEKGRSSSRKKGYDDDVDIDIDIEAAARRGGTDCERARTRVSERLWRQREYFPLPSRWRMTDEINEALEVACHPESDPEPELDPEYGNSNLCEDGDIYNDAELLLHAKKLMVKMETRECLLGPEHPKTLSVQAHLARTYTKLGLYRDAEKLMVKVMETRERLLGPLHRETLNAQQSLAIVMKTRERLLGPLHPETLSAKESLAINYEAMGRYREAEKLRMKVLDTKLEKLKNPPILGPEKDSLHMGPICPKDCLMPRIVLEAMEIHQLLLPQLCNRWSYMKRKHKAHTHDQATPFSKNSNLCLDGRITQRSTHSVAGGGYANTWTGKLGDTKVAIKILRFSSKGVKIRHDKLMRRAWREYLAWSSLSHPNILNLLITPWMSHEMLVSYIASNLDINRIHLDRIKVIMITGISSALVFLHRHNPPIVHGDISAGNILVSDKGIPSLTDFGLSRFVDDMERLSTSSNVAGSLRWMAPELLHNENASRQNDVWAFGMTILENISEKPPYCEITSDPAVIMNITQGKIPPRPELSAAHLLSDDIWDIYEEFWTIDAHERPLMIN